jgi:transposase InsO family protein
LTHRDNLVTITISTAFSRIRGDQGAWFHRSTRLTPPINLIDTGQEALNRALGHRQIEPDQLLIHTDQGSQYRATAYRQLLEGRKISCSMSAKGCCWNNAVVESFFSTLKHELELDDDVVTLNSPQQLIRHLAFWIDGYYNRERRHSTISYFRPVDYEQQFVNTRTLTPVEP